MKKTVVIDTSIMDFIGIVDLIEHNFDKIIITISTLKEFEQKKQLSTMSENIRKLFKRCARDKKSNKYGVIDIDITSSYVDYCIIDFLRNGKNKDEICLLTKDNGMACLAKGYGIDYYFPWELERGNNEEVNECNETISNQIKTMYNQTITGSVLINGELYLEITDTPSKKIVIDKNQAQKSEGFYGVKLDKEDRIYIIKVKENTNSKTLKESRYVISMLEFIVRDINKNIENTDFLDEYIFPSEKVINESNFPQNLKHELLQCFKDMKFTK